MKRRLLVSAVVMVLAAGAGVIAFIAAREPATRSPALSARSITIYRSPTCSCCKRYERYLENLGYAVKAIEIADTAAKKTELGIPQPLWSCHSSLIGGYVVEGHVPVEIVERLLTEKPAVAGIALPGMPDGAPGMEGTKTGQLHVVSFTTSGVIDHFAAF